MFKALLFARRFDLSARRELHGTSELGYMLGQPSRFAGVGYYRAGASGFEPRSADFDFDFLPLLDNYYARPPARTPAPTHRRSALRPYSTGGNGYLITRSPVRRYAGAADASCGTCSPRRPRSSRTIRATCCATWRPTPGTGRDLTYFQSQNVPVYAVTSDDLCDDRWVLRAWHADRWLSRMRATFTTASIESARPDLWQFDDPSGVLPGESQAGNANLVALVTDSRPGDGRPRRYDDLRRVNDGLRERGRRALVSYLCRADRVALPWRPGQFATTPEDLSDLLLLDVEAGPREKASRIDEAITAAQTFIRRCRLGLEPGWVVTREFARLWDSRFATSAPGIGEAARALPGELDRVGRDPQGPAGRGVQVP